MLSVCATAGSDIKLASADLAGYGMIGNPQPTLGISALGASSDSDFTFFSGSNFNGASSKYSNFPDGSLTHKVYPGVKLNTNDNVNSVVFSTKNTDPVTQSC